MTSTDERNAEPDWEAIYRAELPRVYNFFLYRVGERTLAEDLTATTFQRAWQSRHHYNRDRAGFAAWLFTIARRVAVDHYRQYRSRDGRIVPIEAAYDMTGDGDAESAVEQRDQRQRLRRAIAALPPREAEIIALKYGAGHSNRDIADLLGLSSTNVSSILHRTVNKLRVLAQLDTIPQSTHDREVTHGE